MKTEKQIIQKIKDLNDEKAKIEVLKPGCDPIDAQQNVYEHKSILNQLSALNWALQD